MELYKRIYGLEIEEVKGSEGQEYTIRMNGALLVERMKIRQISKEKLSGEAMRKQDSKGPSRKL